MTIFQIPKGRETTAVCPLNVMMWLSGITQTRVLKETASWGSTVHFPQHWKNDDNATETHCRNAASLLVDIDHHQSIVIADCEFRHQDDLTMVNNGQ